MAKRKVARKAKAPAKPKRGRPVTTGIGELIGLRCHAPFLAAVDEYRKQEGLSRPAAITKLAEQALAASGH